MLASISASVPHKPSSTFLLKHPFVKNAKGVSILRDLINEAMDVKLKRQEAQRSRRRFSSTNGRQPI